MNSKTVNIYFSNSVFRDIAESLSETLQEKNINVQLTHKLDIDNKNVWILLGANELPPSTLLPPNYIIYQLEQICLKNNKWLTDKYLDLMRKAKSVWDYSRKNIFTLANYGITAQYVPINYSKCLTKINSYKNEKDIDILFMGSVNPRRLEILERLKHKGYKVMMADGGLWGDDRTDILKRSKCLLNIHFYGEDSPLEMARISVLLANKCFIISESGGDNNLERDLLKGIVFSNYKDLIKTCDKFLASDMESKRESIANKGFSIFSNKQYTLPNNFIKIVESCKGDNRLLVTEADKGEEIRPISDSDKIQKIETLVDSDGFSSIRVPDIKEYPTVCLITPTRNRKHFISMTIHQIEKMDYPKDKLEWILVDDSDNKEDFEYIEETVKNLLKNKVKYELIHLDSKKTISYKRNLANSKTKAKYIAHIDDDDYYFDHSLKNKVALLEYYNKSCIGSTELPVYNLMDDSSILTTSNYLPEASMVYRRNFWEQKGFSEHLQGEGYLFTMGRRNELLDIPYLFSMIAINHGNNVTGKTRLFTGSKNVETKKRTSQSNEETITNLLDAMDEESQDILYSIRQYLKRRKDD